MVSSTDELATVDTAPAWCCEVERFEFGEGACPMTFLLCGLAKVTAPIDIAACCSRCGAEAPGGEPRKGPRAPTGVRAEASAILLLQGVVLTMPSGVARPLQGEMGMTSAAKGVLAVTVATSKAHASSCGGPACVNERRLATAENPALRAEASGTAFGRRLPMSGSVLTIPDDPWRTQHDGDTGEGALAHAPVST